MLRFHRLIGLLLLAACTHISPSVTDVEPVAVAAPAERLAGSYAVAVVGQFDQPIFMLGASQIEFQNGATRPGAMTVDMTIVFGEPLKTSLVNGLKKLVTAPQFVEDERQARTAARDGDGAVVVRLIDATASAS